MEEEIKKLQKNVSQLTEEIRNLQEITSQLRNKTIVLNSAVETLTRSCAQKNEENRRLKEEIFAEMENIKKDLPQKTFDFFNKEKKKKHEYNVPQLWGKTNWEKGIGGFLIVIGCFLIVIGIIKTCCILIGICLLILGFCLVATRVVKCFFKTDFYAKVIEIAFVLLTIIAFFFGMFAGTLSESQKHDNAYWLKPKNIFHFSIKQLQNHPSSKNNIQEIKVDSVLQQKDTINYVFVIDKTLSNTMSRNQIEITESARDSIVTLLNDNMALKKIASSTIDKLKGDVTQKSADILLAGLLRQLCKEPAQGDSIKIMLYKGENDITKIYRNVAKSDCLGSIIDQYLSASPPKAGHKTDFVDIFNSLNDSCLLSKKHRNVVFILSDFYHEKKIWQILDKEVNDFFRKDTNLIVKLFQLELDVKNETKKQEIKQSIERTISCIKDNGKYVTVYEFEQGGEFEKLTITDLRYYLSALVRVANKKNGDTLRFYHPVTFGKFNSTNKANVKFSQGGKFILKLKNESFENEIDMQIKSENSDTVMLLQQDRLYLEEIDSAKIYTCNLRVKEMSNDIYLEISNEEVKGRILLQFEELIPKTLCIVMIFVHTMIILLFNVLFCLFCVHLYHCFAKRYECNLDRFEKKKWINRLVLCVTYIVPIIIAFYHLYDVIEQMKHFDFDFYCFWCIFSICFMVLLGIFIIQENKQMTYKCEKCLEKLAEKKHFEDTRNNPKERIWI